MQSGKTIPGYQTLTIDEFVERMNEVRETLSIRADLGRYPGYKRHKDKLMGMNKLAEIANMDEHKIYNWCTGKDLKKVPAEEDVIEFCNNLDINIRYFAQRHHLTKEEDMLFENIFRSEGLGIIESFVQFLHDERKLHGQIVELISESSEGYTGIQFELNYVDFNEPESGEKVDPDTAKLVTKRLYPDRRTALLIRHLQNETIKLILDRINDICLISKTFDNPVSFDTYLEKLAGVQTTSPQKCDMF